MENGGSLSFMIQYTTLNIYMKRMGLVCLNYRINCKIIAKYVILSDLQTFLYEHNCILIQMSMYICHHESI